MKLWLIVPVKPFTEGKSRLAAVLSPQQRHDLNQRLFHNLLEQAKAAQCFTGVIVVGSDPQIIGEQRWETVWFEEEIEHSLNGALEQARRRALARHAEAILVLPADLPHLTPADIAHLYELGKVQQGMVIAPSQDGGTNALLLHPPQTSQTFPFAFGQQSFDRHCTLANQAGLPYQIYTSPSLSFDVDWPEDLAQFSLVPHS